MKKLTASIFSVLALLVLMTGPGTVQAQARLTVDQFLGGMISMSAGKCQGRNDADASALERQGRLLEAHAIRSAEETLCTCMPERARSLRAILSKQERARTITGAEAQQTYLPQIINACAKAQITSTYGEGCAARFAAIKPNSAAFCSCMLAGVQDIADADVAKMGAATANYLDLAQEAKKRGLPEPEKPALIQRFAQLETSCMKP